MPQMLWILHLVQLAHRCMEHRVNVVIHSPKHIPVLLATFCQALYVIAIILQLTNALLDTH